MMHAQPSRPPYLFYSPKCVYSQQLIEMIKRNQSLARKIEPINVHTAKSLPPQLDGVPAILFGGQLLVGPDTFKWVQIQTPQQDNRNNRDESANQNQNNPGMPGSRNQQQQEEETGIPLPSDISSDTKHGIDYTPLPGQEFNKTDISMPRFSYLPGEGTQSNGTDGIDYVAAMDVSTARSDKGAGVAQQLERLQKMRGMDSDRIRENADSNMMYMQGGQSQGGNGQVQGYNQPQGAPGFSGPMGNPMGGMSSQMQMGNQGYNQGYNQGLGQSAYIQPGAPQQPYGNQSYGNQSYGHQQGQNPYEMQAGSRGGYSTQYQQQNNPYRNEADLPKRF